MIILGVDPGTASTGFAVLEQDGQRLRKIDCGLIQTGPSEPPAARLKIIFQELGVSIDRYHPGQMAVEEVFFNKNVRTALAVGQARGVVLLAAAMAGMEVFEYTPLQVKQAVASYGHATKQQVQAMVRLLLDLPALPKPDDVADALAVAICHAHTWNSYHQRV